MNNARKERAHKREVRRQDKELIELQLAQKYSEWIPNNINQRECIQYAPRRPAENDETCQLRSSFRWKMNTDGTPLLDGNLKVLEFIAIQRKDNQQWAIPGGMVEPGQVVSETLKRKFSEEALGQMTKTPEEKAAIADNIEKLFENGIEIYRGYVDDPRNTDNAWMETVAMNFHDESGSAFGQFELEAGDDAQSVRWQRVSSRIPLFASHTAMLRKVAEKHNAAF